MKYYVPGWGETADDATEVSSSTIFIDTFAQLVGEHIWSNRDGWESDWPVDMVVIDDEGAEHKFTIYMEAEPCFRAIATP